MPDLPKLFISAPMPSAYLAYNIFMNRLAIYALAPWFRSQTVDKGEEKSFNKTLSRSLPVQNYPTLAA